MQNNIENKMYMEEKRSVIQELISTIKLKLEKQKILVVDRFEGDFAVCENRDTGEVMNINISKLPDNVKEGDVVKAVNNTYEIDEQKRAEIEERIKEKTKNLFED